MELKDITKEAVILSENATLGEAIALMLTAHTNTLLIVDDEGVLVGEVSVSDLFDGVVPMNFDGDSVMEKIKDEKAFAEMVKVSTEKPVFEFMSSDFDTVHPQSSLMEVAAIAIAHGQARIPVVDHDNHPIGIISRQGLKQILGKYIGKLQ